MQIYVYLHAVFIHLYNLFAAEILLSALYLCYHLDGPQVYTCGNCRTHLTSHDDIISKSFHGRHGKLPFFLLYLVFPILALNQKMHIILGRAYLFDQCVNITTGPAEDRFLITGLHSVSDIFCKRCQTLVGWTYAKVSRELSLLFTCSL